MEGDHKPQSRSDYLLSECVICGTIGFQIAYKDCCSMTCAAEKNTPNQSALRRLQKHNPDKVVEHEICVGDKVLTYLSKKPDNNS